MSKKQLEAEIRKLQNHIWWLEETDRYDGIERHEERLQELKKELEDMEF